MNQSLIFRGRIVNQKGNIIAMSKERWQQVEDSNYYISDRGRVKSLRGIMKLRTIKGRFVVKLHKRSTTLSVHRLVAIAFIPNPDNLPLVKHKDGNFLNCHWTNLEWAPRPSHSGICKRCRLPRPPKHFKMSGINKTTGVVYRRSVCSSCLGREDYARRKKKMLEKLFNKPHDEVPNQLQSPS